MTATPAPDRAWTAVHRILQGAMATQVVGVAAELGVIDTLAEPSPVADVAARHDIPSPQMLRLLRALAGLGCCAEPEAGVFVRTDVGALLASDHPATLRAFARLCASEVTVRPWLRLETGLRTGEPVFTEEFGCSTFEYVASHPEYAAMFNAAMGDGTRSLAELVPRWWDVDQPGTVVDVGGGNGTLLAAILRSVPAARGVLFDRAAGLAGATEVLAAAGVADRCRVVAGDLRESVPDADTYVIKSVLHNWDDENVVALLRRCRAGLRAGGRVLVLDPVLPDRVDEAATEAAPGELINPYLADLHMLVLLGGRERTRADFANLGAEAGLGIERIVDLPVGDVALVELVTR